ncbi:hypothetical protein EPO44_11980 [bacterium]|nr:MAG: hypothetical protein EPO44_11980 [bacterium]
MGRLAQKLKGWWRGEYIKPSLAEIFGEEESKERFRPPYFVRSLYAMARFWLAHWQWIIGTALAIIAIIVAFWRR